MTAFTWFVQYCNSNSSVERSKLTAFAFRYTVIRRRSIVFVFVDGITNPTFVCIYFVLNLTFLCQLITKRACPTNDIFSVFQIAANLICRKFRIIGKLQITVVLRCSYHPQHLSSSSNITVNHMAHSKSVTALLNETSASQTDYCVEPTSTRPWLLYIARRMSSSIKKSRNITDVRE